MAITKPALKRRVPRATGYLRVSAIAALLLALLLPLAFAQSDAGFKAVVVKMNIKNGQVTVLDSQVVYGPAPTRLVEWRDFRITSVSGNGTALGQFGIEDPQVFRLLDFEQGEPTVIIKDDVNFTVVLAFEPGLAEMKFSNYSSNATIASANLTGAVASFCASHENDSDCQQLSVQTPPAQKRGETCLPLFLFGALAAALLAISEPKPAARLRK